MQRPLISSHQTFLPPELKRLDLGRSGRSLQPSLYILDINV